MKATYITAWFFIIIIIVLILFGLSTILRHLMHLSKFACFPVFFFIILMGESLL